MIAVDWGIHIDCVLKFIDESANFIVGKSLPVEEAYTLSLKTRIARTRLEKQPAWRKAVKACMASGMSLAGVIQVGPEPPKSEPLKRTESEASTALVDV